MMLLKGNQTCSVWCPLKDRGSLQSCISLQRKCILPGSCMLCSGFCDLHSQCSLKKYHCFCDLYIKMHSLMQLQLDPLTALKTSTKVFSCYKNVTGCQWTVFSISYMFQRKLLPWKEGSHISTIRGLKLFWLSDLPMHYINGVQK